MPACRLVISLALAAVALTAAAPAAAQPSPAPLQVPFPANADYPPGQVASLTVLRHSYVQGVDVNVDWSSVEKTNDPPHQPTYNWSALKAAADTAYDRGKHIILVVRAANETGGATGSACMPDSAQILPSWEIADLQHQPGLNDFTGLYCDSDLQTLIPDWFSSQFQNAWLTFIDALAHYVSTQPYYPYISYVRIGVGLGGEAFPVMPDGVGSGCAAGKLPCQTDASRDLADITAGWIPRSENFPQEWEDFQESMLAGYEAAFPAVTTDGTDVPAPPLIYPIDAQPTIPGHRNPVDYEVADWATGTYRNIGIGSEGLRPGGIRPTYADWGKLLPMVFANNPDVYLQFQTLQPTTTAANEAGLITAAEDYGAKSIEWYESTFLQGSGHKIGPPSSQDMTQYQTWVNHNCHPGCPAPSNPATVTPAITSFTPTSGPAGTKVTITGQKLWNATVTFNGRAQATLVFDSGTKIIAVVPASASTGHITVTTPADSTGTASSATFTVT
jgi:hypothetical protein